METPTNSSKTQLARIQQTALDTARPLPGYPYAPNFQQESTFRDYFRILKKHRAVIISSVLIVLTLVTIATFRMTPLYEASARIAISKEDSADSLRLNQNANDVDYSYDYNVELDTQAKILQSDTLALKVIEDLQLEKNKAFGGAPAPEKTVKTISADTRRDSEALDKWHGGLAVSKIPRT